MDFISTRGEGAVSAASAICMGMAKDGGLYVPSSFPKLEASDLGRLADMDFYERSAYILSMFLTDFSYDELKDYCAKAYIKFDGEPAPVIQVDDTTFMLELWHGPTLAFKDVALTLLPHLLSASVRKTGSDKKTLVLVATSGDTGKAALEGFADVSDVEIMVFYPSEGVSDMQKLQMQTSKGSNVHAIGIQGNFDDAQTAVKSIFKDPESNRIINEMGYSLSSANSINWGRLAPQIVYYVSAYVDLLASERIKPGEAINYVVPTGNFGNILAAYYAKRMGIPVNKLIVASNANNVLTDFFNKGKYDVNRSFYKTMSPSMDILISSNLERLLFELCDREPEKLKELMQSLDIYGSYEVDKEELREKLPEFVSYFSGEDETAEAISNFYDMFGYLLDPHTAVAVSAYYNYLTDNDDPAKTVIVSTASPYKFASDVLYCVTGKREEDNFKAVKKLSSYTDTDIPARIKELNELPILHDMVIPKSEIKDTVINLLKQKGHK
jgi:threonine synthase